MSLIQLQSSNPDAVGKLSIEQIVSIAGDGKLRDSSEAQSELREYLSHSSVQTLSAHASYCLETAFPKSGQVLQDIVNELGRRLEYAVKNGRYQGAVNSVGYDGIWQDPSGHTIVIEVKTTDAYRLSLETVTGYRDKLLDGKLINRPCSVLIIVGRTDTGELEAQVRGSRHAWDIRLISIDSLINLVRIKESTESTETITKMRKLLTPLEYTRLDELVDIVFTTTRDIEIAVNTESSKLDETETQSESNTPKGQYEFTPSNVIQSIRENIVSSLGKQIGIGFVKKTRALYWDPSNQVRAVCTVSKRYTTQGITKYWYAYHPQWNEFLMEGEKGYFVLGTTDLDISFAIPQKAMDEVLNDLHTTEIKGRSSNYYHVKIAELEDGNYVIQLPKSGSTLMLDNYIVKLDKTRA